MEKSLYQAPAGLPTDLENQEPIEIEIEDPEAVRIGIGGLEIEIEKDEPSEEDFDANLAEFMDDRELQSLAEELIDGYDKDNRDRKEWVQTYVDGLKLLGLRYEERTEPTAITF